MYQKFLTKMKLRKEELGVSDYKLAQVTGLNRSTVKRIFDGEVIPSIENFLILATALRLSCRFVKLK